MCEYGDVRVIAMVMYESKCVSGSVIMCEYRDLRVIGYVQVEMCEWSGHNVRVNMECASTVMCE